jgi:hypothetical protein
MSFLFDIQVNFIFFCLRLGKVWFFYEIKCNSCVCEKKVLPLWAKVRF